MIPIWASRGPVILEPLADEVDVRQLGPGVALELGVPLELAAPAADLAFEPVLRLAEVAEPDRLVVDRAERRGPFGHLLREVPRPVGIVGVGPARREG